MSFPRYPKYKDSGVEWLGEVPTHWAVRRVSSLSRKITNGYVGPTGDILKDEGVRYLQSLHIKGNQIRFEVPYFVSVEWSNQHGKSILKTGDVLIVQTGDIGQVAVATEEFEGCNCHALIIVAPMRSVAHGEWISWVLNSDYGFHTLLSIQTGALHPHLNCGDVKDIAIPLPPPTEQSFIAAFLDRETAKIDELVAEQQRLIELLKEKRQAVISHAVMKGLNPHAPMRPSGIEWLDDVPAHWRTSALKHLAKAGAKTFTDGDWIEAPYITSEGVRLLQTGNVGIGFYKEQGFRYVSEETFEQLGCTEVKPRDVLICRLDGPVGRACLAPDLGVRMITSVDNAILKCADDFVPEFVVALLSSVPWISWIDALCRVGGGFRLRVSRSQLGELRVPVPPFEEQLAIAEYLASEITKWDALAAEAQRAIDLLQERRTALISAAVTGQIDVRQLAEKKAAA